MVHYTTLDPDRSEIRLLTLLPGKLASEIQCTMHIVSLDDASHFEAVSYVWGNANTTRTIRVNGSPFSVTANLEAALRALRRRRRARILWADAVCINQSDLDEKNIQIPLMRQLYSTASSVVAWLGDDIPPNLDYAISWAQTNASSRFTFKSLYWYSLDLASKFSRKYRFKRADAIVRAYDGLIDLFTLVYWSRLWTFAEYHLANKEPLSMIGRRSFKLGAVRGDKLPVMGLVWEAHHDAGDALTQADLESGKLDELSELFIRWRGLEIKRSSFATPAFKASLWRADRIRSKETTLCGTLKFTDKCQCSDPLDKIYALHGVIPGLQARYPADYTKSAEEVMLEATVYIINDEKEDVYIIFGLRENRFARQEYPSWVPDYTAHSNLYGSSLLQSLIQTPSQLPEVIDGCRTLRLHGWELEPCQVVFQFGTEKEAIIEQIHDLVEDQSAIESLNKRCTEPKDVDVLRQRLISLFSAPVDEKGYSGYTLSEYRLTYQSIFADITDGGARIPDEDKTGCWRVLETYLFDLVGKALFVTTSGYLGLGPPMAESGDLVVIPPKIGWPMLLRETPPDSASEQTFFKMVGPAFVLGLHEGRTCDTVIAAAIEAKEMREFLVR